MYELHCPNCGWTSTMTPEAEATAVAEAAKLNATHHVVQCPRCQWVLRVPVAALHAVPVSEAPVLLAPPEPTLLLEAEKPVTKPVPAVKKTAARRPLAAKKSSTVKKTVSAKKPAAKAKKSAASKKVAAKKPAAKKVTPRKSVAAKKLAAKKPTARKK